MQGVFYFRHGCHLCEEMAAVLHELWPAQFDALEWVDIDSSPQLKEKFNTLIPVLEIDGVIICQHFPDLEKLAECFGPGVKQVS